MHSKTSALSTDNGTFQGVGHQKLLSTEYQWQSRSNWTLAATLERWNSKLVQFQTNNSNFESFSLSRWWPIRFSKTHTFFKSSRVALTFFPSQTTTVGLLNFDGCCHFVILPKKSEVAKNPQDEAVEKTEIKPFCRDTQTHKCLWDLCFCVIKTWNFQFFLEQKIKFFGLKLTLLA